MSAPSSHLNDLCAETRALASRHLTMSLSPSDIERMRLHLAECPDCKGARARMVKTAAALGHARREVRDLETTAKAMARRQMAEDESRDVVGKRSKLRLFLYPALMAILLWTVSREFPSLPSVVVTRQAGVVSISGTEVGDDPTKLGGGQVVEAGPNGRAELALGESRLRLDPNAAVRLQERTPLIFDLGSGAIEVTGPMTVQSDLGLAVLRAGDVLAMSANGMHMQLTAHAGEPKWFDAKGELILVVGETTERGISITD